MHGLNKQVKSKMPSISLEIMIKMSYISPNKMKRFLLEKGKIENKIIKIKIILIALKRK